MSSSSPADRFWIAEFLQPFNLHGDILDAIMKYCATSPQARHNQVANTCRRLSVFYRCMHHAFVKRFVKDVRVHALAHPEALAQEYWLALLDLEEIL
jgi:hypothetical protein